MADPVKPQAKRAKPAPAIFANPEAESPAFVSAPATFPDAAAAVPPVTPPAAEPVAAGASAVVEQARDTAQAAAASVEDATETAQQATASVVAAAMPDERTVETVTARTHETVSAFSKGPFFMATAFDTTRAQDMMGDISARAKGAMEKSVKFAEEVTEFTKGNVEAIVTSGRVAAKGMELMAQDAAETAKSGFEQAQTAMKSFTQVKSPTELFQLQSDYAKTAFDQLVANASKASEQMMKFMGDVAQPLSNRYALASEKVKSAAF